MRLIIFEAWISLSLYVPLQSLGFLLDNEHLNHIYHVDAVQIENWIG